MLADFVVGREPEGRAGFRFVRIPGQKRVYAARMDVDLSTRFEDWIERDLLKLERDDVEEVIIKDYSIDERTGRLDQRDVVTLTKDDDGKVEDGPHDGRARRSTPASPTPSSAPSTTSTSSAFDPSPRGSRPASPGPTAPG